MFCQDPGIALKIFELALKRYGMQAECVREYISYMSRLNGKSSVVFNVKNLHIHSANSCCSLCIFTYRLQPQKLLFADL